MAGTLYLIPAPLGEGPPGTVIPAPNFEIISGLRYFIAEEIRTARRFIKKVNPGAVIGELSFSIFNEHTPEEEIPAIIQPLAEDHDTGLLSEAGLPCVADPGSKIVRAAHEAGIAVKPLSGPSSIMLALMASGMNGQQFAFHGYLPIDKNQRIRKIRELEQSCIHSGQTQIFIEAPYRNLQLFDALLQNCHPDMLLCMATDLTAENESVIVKSIGNWKRSRPDINKKPTVFLLNRQ